MNPGLIAVLVLSAVVALLVGLDVRRNDWDPWAEFDELAKETAP